MIQPRIRQNPFETYEEVAEGFEDLLAPLELFFDREYQGHVMRRHFYDHYGD